MWTAVLALPISFCFLQSFAGASDVPTHHMHLGCYNTAEPGKDTDGLKYHYATLELSTCAAGCNKEGYPYISLQRAIHCLCVSEYGKGGLTFGSACSETCNTDRTFACGGESTENVYYAVNTARQVVDERIEMFKTSTKTFHQARKDCVRSNGDLVTIRDVFQMERLVQMVNQSGGGSLFWIGLSRTSWRASRRWSVPYMPGLDSSDRSVYWAAGHPVEESHCTLLDPVSLTWHSASCHEEHPYLCVQMPPPPTPPPVLATDPPPTTTMQSALEQVDPNWVANQFLILWIMLPIFIMCYGGSCVGYTSYKAYKECKKSRRKVRRATMVNDVSSTNVLQSQVKPGTSEDRVPLTTLVEPLVVTTENEGASREEPPAYTQTPVTAIPPARKSSGHRRVAKKKAPQPKPEPEDEGDIDFTKLSISDILYIRAMLGMNDKAKSKKKKKKIVTS